MSSAATVRRQFYPNLSNPNLPYLIGCPKEVEEKDHAKKAFKRICPKNAIITAVEGFDANPAPACVWRVYYQIKNEHYVDDDSNSGNSNQPPPDLPKDQASLLDFFQKLTSKAGCLDLEVVRKYKTENTAVVEYFPRECECKVQDFNTTTEEPGMWSIKQAEINLEKLKIHS